MSLIFWDTNLFVYWLEDHPQFAPKVHRIRRRMLERNDRLCTSTLTLGEVLTGPYVRQDEAVVQHYRSVLRAPFVEILPFSEQAADHYARLRARLTIAPPDAVQLASAAGAGVDLFLTNDKRLSRLTVPGIQFIAGLDAGIL